MSPNVSTDQLYMGINYVLQNHMTLNQTLEQSINTITQNLKIYTIAFNQNNKWEGSSKIMGQHTKMWTIDDEIFYIGSDNLYPSKNYAGIHGNLQEWGIIVDKYSVVENYVDTLFDNAIHHPVNTEYLHSRSPIINSNTIEDIVEKEYDESVNWLDL